MEIINKILSLPTSILFFLSMIGLVLIIFCYQNRRFMLHNILSAVIDIKPYEEGQPIIRPKDRVEDHDISFMKKPVNKRSTEV